jgi:hypothetical protein
MKMNSLVKFGTGGVPAKPEDLLKGLQTVGNALHGASGGVPFLRLLKSGVFAYGPENIEPIEGSEWAVNPYSVMHGYACWGDGELLDERMVPFNQPAPVRADLPDYGNEWGQQVSVMLQCLTGEDKGVTVLYKGTSTGLRNAVKETISAIVSQVQADPVHIVPVVALESTSYQHKKYGEIFVPVLAIQKWVSFDGVAEAAPADDEATDDAPAPTPAPPTRAAPAAPGARRGAAPPAPAPAAAPAARRRRA